MILLSVTVLQINIASYISVLQVNKSDKSYYLIYIHF